MITKSPRTEITAVHLRPRVKEALRDEAHKRGREKGLPRVSMSQVISDAVEEKLTTLGYNLVENPQDRETPLLDNVCHHPGHYSRGCANCTRIYGPDYVEPR